MKSIHTHSPSRGRELGFAVSLVVALVIPCFSRPVLAQTGHTIPADFATDPLSYYLSARYSEAMTYSAAALSDPATPVELRNGALLTMGTIAMARRQQGAAAAAFLKILADDPVVDLDRPKLLPPSVVNLFYHLRDSICLAQLDPLVAQHKLGADLRTIAIGEIENNSLVKAPYDLDNFCKGLTQIVMNDLSGATDLKIVERQRLDVLLRELDLNKDPGRMAPDARVRMGQLCGAQSYLFGQFMQVDKATAHMDFRWIETATGLFLVGEGVDGKVASGADLFLFEKQVVAKLIPAIQKVLGTQAPTDLQIRIQNYMDLRRKAMPRGQSYLTYVQATGEAITKEREGDVAGAVAAWNQAAKAAPGDKAAASRSQALLAFKNAVASDN